MEKDKISIHEASLRYPIMSNIGNSNLDIGTRVEITESFLSHFKAQEGELCAIYGKIGQGKTTLAVSMVRTWLMQGKVVYTSFPMNWSGFDQRKSLFWLFLGLLGIKNQYLDFPKENYHYLDCFRTDYDYYLPNGEIIHCSDVWDLLPHLTDCIIVFDDVIVQLFDSYEKTFFSKKKREWAFFTRHFDRSIFLVTQRTSQIQLALRSQINRFYKCEKLMSWPFILFRRSEYQDMINENVNDEVEPDSVSHVIGSSGIFSLFNSKYLRNGKQASQRYYVNAYLLSFQQKLKLISNVFEDFFSALKQKKNPFEKKIEVVLSNEIGAGSISTGIAPLKNGVGSILQTPSDKGSLKENLPLF